MKSKNLLNLVIFSIAVYPSLPVISQVYTFKKYVPQVVVSANTGLELQVSANSVMLPATSQGSTSTAAFSISKTNPDTSVNLNSISVSGGFSIAYNCGSNNILPFNLVGADNCVVNVSSVAGATPKTGMVEVTYNNSKKIYVTVSQPVAISEGNVSINKTNVVFPAGTGSENFSDQIRISNSGGTSFLLKSISISNPWFIINNSCANLPTPVLPGASCLVTVSSSSSMETKQGAITITTDLGSNTVTLNQPAAVPLDGSEGLNSSVSSLVLAGGDGVAPEVASIRIQNNNTADLPLSAIGLTGNFTYSDTCGTLPKQMSANSYCDITVAAIGSPTVKSGNLTISYGSGKSLNIPVSQSVAVNNRAGALTTPTSFVSFSKNNEGVASSVNVVLTNASVWGTTIESVAMANPGAYSLSGTCIDAAVVGQSQSCSLTVTTIHELAAQSNSVIITYNGNKQLVIPVSTPAANTTALISSQNSLAYSGKYVEQTESKSISVTNTGDLPVNISSITASEGVSLTYNCDSGALPTLLQVGQTCSVAAEIIYGSAPQTKFLTINYGNSQTITVSLNISAGNPLPEVTLSPSTSSLVLAGGDGITAQTGTVRVQNNEQFSTKISNIQVPAGFSYNFTCEPLTYTLTPGSFCDITVSGVGAASQKSGTIIVVYGNQKTLPISLIQEAGSNNTLGTLVSSKNPVTYNTNVSGFSESTTFRLTNGSNWGTTVTSVSLPSTSGYSLSTNCNGSTTLPAVLSYNQYCTVTVTTTHSTSAQSSVITVSYNNNNSLAVNVSTPAASLATADLDISTIAFPATSTGDQSLSSRTVTLSNNGGRPLGISSLSLTGANSADYSSVTTCGATLNPGSSCTATISVPTVSSGVTSAYLDIVTDLGTSRVSLSTTAYNLGTSGSLSAGATSGTLNITTNGGATFVNPASVGLYNGASLVLGTSNVSWNSSTKTLTATFSGTIPSAGTYGLKVFNSLGAVLGTTSVTVATGASGAITSGNGAFGAVTKDLSFSKIIVFKNTGGVALTGVYAAIANTVATSITSNTCGTAASKVTLAVSSTCSVTVAYAPTDFGNTLSGTLSFTSDNAAVVSTALTGTVKNLTGVVQQLDFELGTNDTSANGFGWTATGAVSRTSSGQGYGNSGFATNVNTGGYYKSTLSGHWNKMAGDFTFEVDIYPTSLSGSANVMAGSGGGYGNWSAYIFQTNQLVFEINTDPFIYNYTPTLNTWTRLKWQRVGSTTTLYINGVSKATWSNSTNLIGTNGTGTMYVGLRDPGEGLGFVGRLDNVRFTRN